MSLKSWLQEGIEMQNYKVVSETNGSLRARLVVSRALGFRKTSGKWTITHQHSSVPFYMNGNFKAAIGLKP